MPDESQVIHVVWREVAANYDRFNDKPVVITGVIDTSQRGLWGYRCGIWLERISVLHPSPEREARDDGTLLKQMQETLVRVRSGRTLDARADAAEHLTVLTRKIDPGDVDDKTFADLVSLVDLPEKPLPGFVAAALGYLGVRAKPAVPKLLEILAKVDCEDGAVTSADAIRLALKRIGVTPPPRPECEGRIGA